MWSGKTKGDGMRHKWECDKEDGPHFRRKKRSRHLENKIRELVYGRVDPSVDMKGDTLFHRIHSSV